MIWLAWRQFRIQAIVAAGALAALAIVLLITGSHLRDLYDAGGLAACKARGGCGASEQQFLTHDAALQSLLGPLVLAVPVLIGVFWGAPLLAREFESATFKLVWTQSVSRQRWLAGQLAVVGVASVVVAELANLLVTWWFVPIDATRLNRFDPTVFSERGVVCAGYTAFAFALGLAVGASTRRTVVAMALTLIAFFGARVVSTYAIRPHFATPIQARQPLAFGTNVSLELGPAATLIPRKPTVPNAWVQESWLVGDSGRTPGGGALHSDLQRDCPAIALPHAAAGPAAFAQCEAVLASRFGVVVRYQPAQRYGAFQWDETAIFLALAIVLIGGCFWWLRPPGRAS